MSKRDRPRISTGLAGVAGEYFVAAELSRRGYLTTLTQRNSKGVDVLVSNETATKSAAIQVKTNQVTQKHWVLTAKAETFHAPRLFYVFVNLDTASGAPEYYVVPSETVAVVVEEDHMRWLRTPGKDGRMHVDNSIRQYVPDPKYRDRWELLELDISHTHIKA